MPHKISEAEGEAAKKQARESPPFGPGFPETVVSATTKLETWGSSFKDSGPDWCEFRVFDTQGEQIGARRVDGY